MDATEEKELAEEFEIGGFPTLKLFVNGDRKTPTSYDGTHTHTLDTLELSDDVCVCEGQELCLQLSLFTLFYARGYLTN